MACVCHQTLEFVAQALFGTSHLLPDAWPEQRLLVMAKPPRLGLL